MLMWGDVHSCSGCAVRVIRSSRVAVVQAVRKRLGSRLVAVSEERLASGVARVAALLVGALAAHAHARMGPGQAGPQRLLCTKQQPVEAPLLF